MGDKSAIEWTDATWNPVRGCVKVSPGCAHCYAETFAERFRGVKGHPYQQGFDLRLVPEKLTEPLTWKKPRRVFVNSMSDLFQDGVPDDYIDRAFAVMALAYQHTFQVLTKRPERMREYLSSQDVGLRWLATVYRQHSGRPEVDDCAYQENDAVRWTREGLPNVWLGVSVENQHFADERIPLLLQTPAALRFISAEPLLGPVRLHESMFRCCRSEKCDESVFGLDWVIIGGESGPKARGMDVSWARSIVQQCQAASVPVFVKQLGRWPISNRKEGLYWCELYVGRYGTEPTGEYGLESASRKNKGGDPSEWPEDLRVREFPIGVR